MSRPARVMRWLLGNIIVLAGLLLVGYLIASLVLLPRLSRMLDEAVRRELELPDSALVEVQLGSLRQTLSGYLPEFHVDSPSAVLDDIPFQGLRFDASGVDFNMRRILKGDKAQITAVGSAQLKLRMSADELAARLVPMLEEEGISDVHVQFDNNSISVSGSQDRSMAATGQFYVTDDSRVGFALTEFQFSTLNITVSDLSLVLDDFLPALDLGGMYAQVLVDELHSTSEYIEIVAHTISLDPLMLDRDLMEVF
ncbi:hypothetical protein KDL29_14085 [bacterium]|nr:hypothetical protein [bacterium]